MDRIKSQREEWVNSRSMMEVGDDTEQGMLCCEIICPVVAYRKVPKFSDIRKLC